MKPPPLIFDAKQALLVALGILGTLYGALWLVRAWNARHDFTFECDFTKEPAFFAGDAGTFTACGVTWTRVP